MLIAGLLGMQAWQTIPVVHWLIGPQESGWRGALRWWTQAPWLYPFIDYPMYSQAREQGEPTLEPRVRATLENGIDRAIGPEDLALDYFMFKEQMVGAITRADADQLRQLVKPIELLEHHRVSSLQLELEPIRLGEHGIERGPREPRERVVLSRSVRAGADSRP
jgi:hypothetical protein